MLGLVRLVRAACVGETTKEEDALKHGADPNGRGTWGLTPLIWAEACGNLAGMEVLLKAGADPNYKLPSPGGATAVGFASEITNPAVLKLMLKYHGDPNTTFVESPHTALDMALEVGKSGSGWDNYYALLNAGADINCVYAGNTIVTWAASLDQYDKVSELLDRGYKTDLIGLGGLVTLSERVIKSQSKLSPELSSQALWLAKVKAKLEDNGVKFPVPPLREIPGYHRPPDSCTG